MPKAVELLTELKELSKRCVDTYVAEDVVEHLEEELVELLLAYKRLSRERGTVKEFLEEIIDVIIECNTVITLMIDKGLITAGDRSLMTKTKMAKFRAMLDRDKLTPGESKKNRYKGLPKCS